MKWLGRAHGDALLPQSLRTTERETSEVTTGTDGNASLEETVADAARTHAERTGDIDRSEALLEVELSKDCLGHLRRVIPASARHSLFGREVRIP